MPYFWNFWKQKQRLRAYQQELKDYRAMREMEEAELDNAVKQPESLNEGRKVSKIEKKEQKLPKI